MFQFRDHEDLKGAIMTFHEAHKPAAALCHGTCVLLDVKLSDGSCLIEGKAMTGFPKVEEDFGEASVGQKRMPSASRTKQRREAGSPHRDRVTRRLTPPEPTVTR
jgi:putative intracellular protease/amidase